MAWVPGVTNGSTMASEFNAIESRKATNQEYFDKTANKTATAEQIATDGRIQTYNVNNNASTLSQVLAPGSSYNILTSMLESNETLIGTTPTFKDKDNITQSTYLDETNNKFLFPSNLYTYNNSYTPFAVRVIFTIDHPSVGSNQLTTLAIRIKRIIDDSIISKKSFEISNKSAQTNFIFTSEFFTFVNGETDPYVLNGMYLEIENSSDSDTNVTLKECDVRLFKL